MPAPPPISTAPSNVPIVGQPCQLLSFEIPVNAIMRCNCSPTNEPIVLRHGDPVQCQSCQKIYKAFYDPSKPGIQIAIGIPQEAQQPS